MSTKTVQPPQSAPLPCSAAFYACKIGFGLEEADGGNHVPEDAAEEALLSLNGDGWSADEMCLSPCGVVVVIEFEKLPSERQVEAVRREIDAVIRGPLNSQLSDPVRSNESSP